MTDTALPLYVLLAMAVATYALRLGGLAVVRFTEGSPNAAAFLQRVSWGALIGLVVPAAVEGDWAARDAVATAGLVAVLTRSVLLSMLSGAAVAAISRTVVLLM